MKLGQIVGEASTWARLDKSKMITKNYVQKPLMKRIERIKNMILSILQMIKEGALLINTEEKVYKIGQQSNGFNCYYNWRLFIW